MELETLKLIMKVTKLKQRWQTNDVLYQSENSKKSENEIQMETQAELI